MTMIASRRRSGRASAVAVAAVLSLGGSTRTVRAQASMSPADAWVQLKQHAQMIEELNTQHYTPAMQLVQVMRSAGGAPAGSATEFMDLVTLIRGEHRNNAQTLFSSTSNTVKWSTGGLAQLRALKDEFVNAARQMQRDPTPAAKHAFEQ